MDEFLKYEPLLSTQDRKILENKFNFSNTSLSNFYNTLITNWDKILNSDLSSALQAIFSYLLLINDDREKARGLFEKYPTIAVMANYARILIIEKELSVLNDFIEKYEKEKIPTENIFEIEFLGWCSHHYCVLNEFEKSSEIFEKAKTLLDQISLEPKYLIAKIHMTAFLKFIRSYNQYQHHQYSLGILNAEESLSLLEEKELKDSFLLGYLFNNLGNCLLYSGSLNDAKNEYEKALNHFQKNQILRGILVVNANLSVTLLKQGKFQEGLDKLLPISLKMEKKQEIRNSLMITSEIVSALRFMENYSDALSFLEKNIRRSEKYNIAQDFVYPHAIELYAILGEYKKAEKFLAKFKKIYIKDFDTNSVFVAIYYIHKGIIDLLKMNYFNSEKNLIEGLKRARDLNQTPLVLHVLLYLIELYLISYKIELDLKSELLRTIEVLCQEAIILLKELNSIYHLVNYQQLLASIYLITGKMNLALEVLEKTKQICHEYNLTNQICQVEKLQNTLDQINFEILDNEEKTNLNNLFYDLELTLRQYASKGLLQSELELKPQDFAIFNLLIILPSGLPIYSFKHSNSMLENDELLLAGMINAIRNFSNSLVLKNGDFRMLEHSNYILLLEVRDDFILALFTDHFNYEFKKKVQKMAKLVEQHLSPYDLKEGKLRSKEILEIEDKFNSFVHSIFNLKKTEETTSFP